MKSSFESKLQTYSICSIIILNILEVIVYAVTNCSMLTLKRCFCLTFSSLIDSSKSFVPFNLVTLNRSALFDCFFTGVSSPSLLLHSTLSFIKGFCLKFKIFVLFTNCSVKVYFCPYQTHFSSFTGLNLKKLTNFQT